jgi:hypothetical protein
MSSAGSASDQAVAEPCLTALHINGFYFAPPTLETSSFTGTPTERQSAR